MKKIFIMFSVAGTLGLALMSCEKEYERIAVETNVGSDKALLKVNFVSQYTGNPSVQIKLNDVRISNLITARTPFPGGGFNTGGGSTNDYLAVNPGQSTLKISIPNKGTETDSVVLFNTSITLANSKNYTAHITDTGTNTKILLLEDSIAQPASGKSKYRFVHLMPNVAAADLYYGTTLVASNVKYLESSPYFELPIPATALAWNVRETLPVGVPIGPVIATYAANISTSGNRRVYTAFTSGYKGEPAASTKRPFISFLFNY